MANPAQLNAANFYDLRRDKKIVSYTESNIQGKPVVTYIDGGVTRSFVGDEIDIEKTALGSLVTVTLEVIPDKSRSLLTLVLPEVLLKDDPEYLSAPVLFHTIEMSIAGPPTSPGAVQTYVVDIFSGTASFIVS
jgi:hypothetical protein